MNEDTLLFLLPSAIALSIERLSYLWIWRNPLSFQALCARASDSIDPVTAVQRLFYGFKAIQLVVFFAWIAGHGNWFSQDEAQFLTSEPVAIALGCALGAFGQILNFSVFCRLGRTGTFYGVRFGRDVPWVRGFPFSILDHPQYVGTVASIWALFLLTRFPEPDWIVLPLLETVYYVLSARFERDAGDRADDKDGPRTATAVGERSTSGARR